MPVDHAVHRGEVRIGLHSVGVGLQVDGKLLGQRYLVRRRLGVDAEKLFVSRTRERIERRVGLAQMLLLRAKNRVVFA